jgi:transitional endoplasmic reticulum ATPase
MSENQNHHVSTTNTRGIPPQKENQIVSIDTASPVTKKTSARGEKAILELLFELGGGQVTEADIVFEGTQIKLPTTVSKRQAIKLIQKSIEDEETLQEYQRTFDFRPWDGAYSMNQALIAAFGTAGFGVTTQTMFGINRPEVIQVRVGKKEDGTDETVPVPWGTFDFPLLQGSITTGAVRDRARGPLFHMTITVPKKNAIHAEGLFRLIDSHLRQHSIYRGKAFDGAEEPSFINPYSVDRNQVVYTDAVMAQMEANMWSMIRHTDLFEGRGLSLKRAVLLEGPYGTGKTLGAYLTAQEAVENGWTFIQCRPGVDDLNTVLQTAKLYQPAVVFYEDIDTLANTGDPQAVSKLLDMFDGITAKGTKLLVVLTTNNPDKIHEGMLRPGRLDSRIQISSLDSGAIEKLIRAKVPSELLDPETDFAKIEEAMEGYLPAFITEAIDRAQRYAIARTGGAEDVLTTSDFVFAAEDVRPQYEAMQAARAIPQAPAIQVALQTLVGEVVEGKIGEARFVDGAGNPTSIANGVGLTVKKD